MANRARQNRNRQLLSSLPAAQKLQLLCGNGYEVCGCAAALLPAVKAGRLMGGALQLPAHGTEEQLWPAAQCAVQFPAPSALACSFDRELVADVAEAIAEQCRAAGVGLLVGPSLALQRDAACGDNFMRFSEDPLLAGSLAAAFTEGLRKGGVLCCLTDFGAAASVNDRAAADVLADKQTLQDIWFEAARTAFAAAPAAVMCSESKLRGCAAAQSRAHGVRRPALQQTAQYPAAILRPFCTALKV